MDFFFTVNKISLTDTTNLLDCNIMTFRLHDLFTLSIMSKNLPYPRVNVSDLSSESSP